MNQQASVTKSTLQDQPIFILHHVFLHKYMIRPSNLHWNYNTCYFFFNFILCYTNWLSTTIKALMVEFKKEVKNTTSAITNQYEIFENLGKYHD